MTQGHLHLIQRLSVGDEVFQQLSTSILRGDWKVGQALPAERDLAQTMGISRQLVREAVRRLEQAGLVAIRHGVGSWVQDFRRTAGLDLLPHLLLDGNGSADWRLVQSVMEMRSALAPDAARLCALRNPAVGDTLRALVADMAKVDELAKVQDLVMRFFDAMILGSDNLAYRLAFNSLRAVYDPVRAQMAPILEAELRDLRHMQQLADCIAMGDGPGASDTARVLLEQGQLAVEAAIAWLQLDHQGQEAGQ